MPLYEYRCAECGHRFEVLQRMGEGNESLVCPSCESPEPERRLSTFASGGVSAPASESSGPAACGSGFT